MTIMFHRWMVTNLPVTLMVIFKQPPRIQQLSLYKQRSFWSNFMTNPFPLKRSFIQLMTRATYGVATLALPVVPSHTRPSRKYTGVLFISLLVYIYSLSLQIYLLCTPSSTNPNTSCGRRFLWSSHLFSKQQLLFLMYDLHVFPPTVDVL
jgi:hypothetical protein